MTLASGGEQLLHILIPTPNQGSDFVAATPKNTKIHSPRPQISYSFFLCVFPPTNISKMVTPCDVPVGVITGDNVLKLLHHAKDNGYAIPAFNCTR